MNNSQSTNVRSRRCGHCRQTGHDRRNCPVLREQQSNSQSNTQSNSQSNTQSNAQSNVQPVETEWNRIQRIRSTRGTPQHQQGPVRTNRFTFDGSAGSIPNFNSGIQNQIDTDLQYALELDKQSINKFAIINNRAEYDIYVYWISELGKDYTNEKTYDLKYIKYIENNKSYEILSRYGDQYVITNTYFGKKLKFSDINTDHIMKIISVKNRKEIHTIVNKQSELIKWKSATLKSKKILDDIEKYGKGSSDIIDTLLDCIQDINYPTITEEDKEHSGVASILTNVCTMTNIDEDVNAGNAQRNLMNSNPHLLNNTY